MAKATKDLRSTQKFVLQYKEGCRGYLQEPLNAREKEAALEEAILLWERLCYDSKHGEISDPSLEVWEKDASPIVDKPKPSQKIKDVALRKDEKYIFAYMREGFHESTVILVLYGTATFSEAKELAQKRWVSIKFDPKTTTEQITRICIGKRVDGTALTIEELEELSL